MIYYMEQKMVKLEDFRLVGPDSHIVEKVVSGYTVEKNGKIFLLEKALKEFPALRVDDCDHCNKLKEKYKC